MMSTMQEQVSMDDYLNRSKNVNLFNYYANYSNASPDLNFTTFSSPELASSSTDAVTPPFLVGNSSPEMSSSESGEGFMDLLNNYFNLSVDQKPQALPTLPAMPEYTLANTLAPTWSTPFPTSHGLNIFPQNFQPMLPAAPTYFKSQPRKQKSPTQFKCQFCDNCFTRKHDLVRHENRHQGIKPFKCNMCSKGFSRHDALIRHSLDGGVCKGLMGRKKRN